MNECLDFQFELEHGSLPDALPYDLVLSTLFTGLPAHSSLACVQMDGYDFRGRLKAVGFARSQGKTHLSMNYPKHT
jgi:hypothetical protein